MCLSVSGSTFRDKGLSVRKYREMIPGSPGKRVGKEDKRKLSLRRPPCHALGVHMSDVGPGLLSIVGHQVLRK